MTQRHLFTSECVTCGHPDKVSDQISYSAGHGEQTYRGQVKVLGAADNARWFVQIGDNRRVRAESAGEGIRKCPSLRPCIEGCGSG